MNALQAPTTAPRRPWLWAALFATLALTLWTAWQDDAGEHEATAQDLLAPRRGAPAPVADIAAAAPGAASAPAKDSALLAGPSAPRPRAAWAGLNTAGRTAWSAPPVAAAASSPRVVLAPAAAPAVAAAPQAPPPPFTLIGRYVDSQGPVALLATPQRTLVVRPGELADPQWRVDAVAAQRIELTWLPGAQKRSLAYPPGT